MGKDPDDDGAALDLAVERRDCPALRSGVKCVGGAAAVRVVRGGSPGCCDAAVTLGLVVPASLLRVGLYGVDVGELVGQCEIYSAAL